MRFAFLLPMMSGRGGTESAVLNLCRGLQKRNDEVRVYLFGGMPKDATWLENVPHVCLGERNQSRLQRFRAYTAGLARDFHGYQPDAVIALDSFRVLKGWLAIQITSPAARLFSWIHFPVEKIKHRWMLQIADGHLAISEGVAEQLRELLGQRSHVTTIYNGISVDVPVVPRPNGMPPHFLHIGRLEAGKQKRTDDLLRALAAAKGDFRLTIIGDGDDRSSLEKLADDLAISGKINWGGWQSEPWNAVDSASLLVLTSSYEGFGMILVEALARGIPCLSTDCKVGPSELVHHGLNGWLYPVADLHALQQHLQAVIDDPSVLPSIEVVRQSAGRFSQTAVADRVRAATQALQESYGGML